MGMLELINAKRDEHGLAALRPNAQLEQAAQLHAEDLSRNPGLIDSGRFHYGSDGSTIGERIARAGYRAEQHNEVTGWYTGASREWAAAWVVDYWMESDTHRPILLRVDMNEIGVGYAAAPNGKWHHVWAVDFGRRVGAPTPEPPVPADHVVHVPVVVGGREIPPSGQFDMAAYLRGDGRAYMVQHPGPDGPSEKFRTVEREGGRWLQLKNSQWEEFWLAGEFVWRGRDTSAGNGQYFRQFEPGQEGARWCPRWMSLGQVWTAPLRHTVQTYDKGSCAPVYHHRNGEATNKLWLLAHHVEMSWNGITVRDVIELLTHTGERMYFGRGYGLVAWGSGWGESAIAHELPANEADNMPESGCFG